MRKRSVLLSLVLLLSCLTVCKSSALSAQPFQKISSSFVDVQWTYKKPIVYTLFQADTYGEQTYISFTPVGAIHDFKLLKLEFLDVSEDGKMVFDKDVIFTPYIFSMERPLIIGITFFGAIPNYGFSFVDESGMLHQYALQISGEDGSLLCLDIK